MKKITALLLTTVILLGFSGSIFGQINETFTNVGPYSGYDTETWTGDDGGTWTATDARTDQSINGEAITVRNGTLTSPTVAGGIGALTLTTQRKYSGGSGDLIVKVNGTQVGTIPYDGTEQTNSITGINVSGDITVVIETPGNGDRVAMDDLIWTAFSSASEATKLVISEVNEGNDPVVGKTFEVTVQAQDDESIPTSASQDTSVTLSVTSASGSLSGTLTGTILEGETAVTFTNISYNVAETFNLVASNSGGSLSSATLSVTTLEAADQLVIKNFPSTGATNTALSSFTVEAQRSSDDSIDDTYEKEITVTKVSGAGNIGGTVTKTAVNGVATFDDITFDAAGSYTISAGDGELTSTTSGSLTIEDITNPSVGTVFITEISDAASDFNAEFIELFNTGSDPVDVSGSNLIRYSSDGTNNEYTFDIGSDGSGSSIIPANGFLIIARGATESEFESEWGSLGSGINFNVGSSNLYFGTGRRWVLEYNGSAIDSTTISVGDGTRHYQFPLGSQTFVEGERSEATPGELDASITITGNDGWRILSFPVTGGTVEDISDNTAIQGVSGGDNADKASNFLTYDSDGAYETPADNTTAIGDGYGFITYFYNNTNAGSSELPLTLDAFGEEPSSDVNVTLNTSTQANGSYFTMVGNPFASNFDLNAVTVNGGSIQNTVQFWDDGSETYTAQDRSTPFLAGTWQGFWVESSDGASDITFPISGKTSSSATGTYFSKERSEGQIADVAFELSSEQTLDKALRLSFRPEAELGWDVDDASKFIPLTETYATLGFIGEDRLQSVFSLPTNLEETVELELRESLVGVSGEFTLNWEGIESIPNGLSLTLHDYQTGETIDMQVQNEYTFEASASAEKRATPMSVLRGPVAELQKAKGTDAPRLGITITANSSVSNEPGETPEAFALEQNYPNPFNPTTSIQYSVANAGEVQLTIYNVMGQRVETLVSGTKSAGTYRVSWDAANMASGIYYYRLQAGNQVLTRQMTLIK